MSLLSVPKGSSTFDPAFNAASQKYGIPVSVLKGVALLESSFNPNAIRQEPQLPPYNAPGLEKGGDASRGLMQVLYRTAWGDGYRGTADGLFDPTTNIDVGAKFLTEIWQQALAKGYNLDSALSVYNGGNSADRPGDGKRDTTRKDGKTADGSAMAPFINQAYVDRALSYIQAFNTGAVTEAGLLSGITPELLLFGALLWLFNE